MRQIEERNDLSFERFQNEIRPNALPIVMRGFVKDWPAVKAGILGPGPCANYIASFANDDPQKVGVGRPEINGLFHYDEGLQGLNFGWGAEPVGKFIQRLLREMPKENPDSMAMQALNTMINLKGFEAQNPRKFAPDYATPYMWIGNSLKVGTHNDAYENIACVVAGCRRFTIFPPDQISNLYIGPLHYTLAGTPISMVHLTAPDYERFPKFAEAMAHAQYVDLLPGDALYLPYHWYHHVESKEKFNILANFWWNDARKDIGAPMTAMMAAMLSIGNLPTDQRKAWRAAFDHFVFHSNGDPWAHIPPHARGALASLAPENATEVAELIIGHMRANLPKQ